MQGLLNTHLLPQLHDEALLPSLHSTHRPTLPSSRDVSLTLLRAVATQPITVNQYQPPLIVLPINGTGLSGYYQNRVIQLKVYRPQPTKSRSTGSWPCGRPGLSAQVIPALGWTSCSTTSSRPTSFRPSSSRPSSYRPSSSRSTSSRPTSFKPTSFTSTKIQAYQLMAYQNQACQLKVYQLNLPAPGLPAPSLPAPGL